IFHNVGNDERSADRGSELVLRILRLHNVAGRRCTYGIRSGVQAGVRKLIGKISARRRSGETSSATSQRESATPTKETASARESSGGDRKPAASGSATRNRPARFISRALNCRTAGLSYRYAKLRVDKSLNLFAIEIEIVSKCCRRCVAQNRYRFARC